LKTRIHPALETRINNLGAKPWLFLNFSHTSQVIYLGLNFNKFSQNVTMKILNYYTLLIYDAFTSNPSAAFLVGYYSIALMKTIGL